MRTYRKNKAVTADQLREVLDYDPATGVFTWRKPTSNRVKVGAIAGARHSQGYVFIAFNCHRNFGHRLAWLYMTGEWPKEQIDHIDGDRTNNRWANLRDVSRQVNNRNRHTVRSPTGYLGVRQKRGKFAARITVDRKSISLGTFRTAEEAHAAYLAAKCKYHGEAPRRVTQPKGQQ